jgi:hypothetical protein
VIAREDDDKVVVVVVVRERFMLGDCDSDFVVVVHLDFEVECLFSKDVFGFLGLGFGISTMSLMF